MTHDIWDTPLRLAAAVGLAPIVDAAGRVVGWGRDEGRRG